MRKKEQRLWDRFRAKVTGVGLNRVENVVQVGFPDVLSVGCGQVFAVELKAVEKYPARPKTPILGREGLSQDQKNWHLEWQRHGGLSLLLIGVGSSDIYVVPGELFDVANEMADLSPFKTSWEQLQRKLRKEEE